MNKLEKIFNEFEQCTTTNTQSKSQYSSGSNHKSSYKYRVLEYYIQRLNEIKEEMDEIVEQCNECIDNKNYKEHYTLLKKEVEKDKIFINTVAAPLLMYNNLNDLFETTQPSTQC